ncbi:MAG: TIGR02757 family protein [Sphingobacteriales bacterium]|nr:MAG: TIGR02757 family protein [Sphingobacteriales bacterium]
MVENLKDFLNAKVAQYNQPNFIALDPVCIPHLFTKKQDIEIMGFLAAILAWGQRVTIINKSKTLIKMMDGAPHDFILNHQETDLKPFVNFKHRTFNATDTLYFIHFLKHHYTNFNSLEDAFLPYGDTSITRAFGLRATGDVGNITKIIPKPNIESHLNIFRAYFFSLEDYPERTKKHISSPMQKSTCKRLNMFLRWMVRNDNCGVDFGIWKRILPSQLICPCDVHVDRVARNLGLITRKQTDWQTALELTQALKIFDANDPVKYDFALFGLGVEGVL